MEWQYISAILSEQVTPSVLPASPCHVAISASLYPQISFNFRAPLPFTSWQMPQNHQANISWWIKPCLTWCHLLLFHYFTSSYSVKKKKKKIKGTPNCHYITQSQFNLQGCHSVHLGSTTTTTVNQFQLQIKVTTGSMESKTNHKKGMVLHSVATDNYSLLILPDWFLSGFVFSSSLYTKSVHEDSMRAQRPLVGPVLTAQHCAAQMAFMREHWWLGELADPPPPFSSQMRAGSHRAHVTAVNKSGDKVVNLMLPVTSSSMTGLTVGQCWPGEAHQGSSWCRTMDSAWPQLSRVCRQFLDEEDIHAIDWPSLAHWPPTYGMILIGATGSAKYHHRLSRNSLMPWSRSGRRSPLKPSADPSGVCPDIHWECIQASGFHTLYWVTLWFAMIKFKQSVKNSILKDLFIEIWRVIKVFPLFSLAVYFSFYMCCSLRLMRMFVWFYSLCNSEDASSHYCKCILFIIDFLFFILF